MLRTVALLAAMMLGGCTGAHYPIRELGIGHPIIDTAGRQIGTVTTQWHLDAWAIVVNATGLPPGHHGLHLHEVGRCDPPDFASAGAHYNPTGKQHGALNPLGMHRGDIDEGLDVAPNGTAQLYVQPTWDAREAPNGLSLVIHANPDDNKTDPSGNSGARIACGIVIPPG
jgi:superoxide dismutase, Cu-Zn family